MKTMLVMCISLYAFVAVPVEGQTLPSGERKMIADELVERSREFLRLLRSRDADAVLALYGRPNQFVHIDNGAVVQWDTLQREVRAYLDGTEENEIYWNGTPTVIVLNRGAAVVFGAHSFRTNDVAEDSHVGEWTGVFELIEGEWLLVHSHSSDRSDH